MRAAGYEAPGGPQVLHLVELPDPVPGPGELLGNRTLTGYYLGTELAIGPRAHERIAALLADVAAGDLQVVIDSRFPLAEAAAAHARAESREAVGRILLIP